MLAPLPPAVMVPRTVLGEVDAALGMPIPSSPTLDEELAEQQDDTSMPLVAHSIIRLLWHEGSCATRIAEQPEWQRLRMELALQRLEAGDEDEAEENDNEDEAAREIVPILSLAEPAPLTSLQGRLHDAVDARGRLSPPLVLLAGEVVMPFDARTRLEVTIACASPFAATAPALAEAISAARDTLEMTGAHMPAEMVERFTERIEQNFEQASRTVSPGYLRDNVDRMLLEQRAYRERRVFGAPHLLAHLSQGLPSKSDSSPQALNQLPPLYLPTSLADELPLMQRFSARLLAEIDLRQDDYEPHSLALRAVALARSLDPTQPG